MTAHCASAAHRPAFHYSPASGWMNDPNGLVYADGVYHLFYQYFPGATVWGPMHWGHATSRDLVHWQEQAVALAPDKRGYIFSGSAVVDTLNSSDLGSKTTPPVVAMFSYHDPIAEKAGLNSVESQALAYSTNGGQSWTKYVGNPVLANTDGLRHFRDPKLFWYEPQQRWYTVLAAGDRVRFYSSPNLRNWTYTGEFGAQDGAHDGVWECPDLFALKTPGETGVKWVLLVSVAKGSPNGGSGTQYFVGDFDGHKFSNGSKPANVLWLDHGRDNYASVSWSGVPDGRRIAIGWMSNWDYAQQVPTTAWRSAMTLPRELSLIRTPAGLRLTQAPVAELARLRGEVLQDRQSLHLKNTLKLPSSTPLNELLIDVDLDQTTASEFGVELRNRKGETYRLGYDRQRNRFYSDRRQAGDHAFSAQFAADLHVAPRQLVDHQLQLHLYFDVASVELFADRGTTVITDTYFPSMDFDQVALYGHGGMVNVTGLQMYALRSARPGGTGP